MDKIDLNSRDILGGNVEKIAELFPGVVTEAKDEATGELKKVVDFDLLRQHLSDELVEGDRERFRLDWPGKKASILKANTPIHKTLRPVREDSEGFDTTENVFIEGDNFEVLKVLQESYLGKVKMIYIDPPYNTGKDFIYRDNFTQGREDYEEEIGVRDDESGGKLVKNTETNGRYHSDWLSMMQERLVVARDLLTDEGMIFISIDDNEVENLKVLCNEVFGENCFYAQISWMARTKPMNSGSARFKFQTSDEYVLAYGKQDMQSHETFMLEESIAKKYELSDDIGQYRLEEIQQRKNIGIKRSAKMVFDIPGAVLRDGYRWTIGPATAKELISSKMLVIKSSKAYRKFYENTEDGSGYFPLWSNFAESVGTSEDGKAELYSLLGANVGFETVKPVELIKKLAFHLVGQDELVVDLFSGSGTTAHAVMKLNAEDGGSRRHIQVQIPESTYKMVAGKEVPTKEGEEAYAAGYKTISELTRTRIKQAAKNVRKTYIDQIAKRETPLDTGFRAYKLSSSNFKETALHPNDTTQQTLLDVSESIKEDRTADDLLTEVILSLGLTLDLPIETRDIAGHNVYFVGGNSLVACFDDKVSLDIVDDIAAEKPLRVVFKDSGFENDEVRINVDIRLKQLSPDTAVQVV